MKFFILIAILIAINYSNAKPTRSLEKLAVNIKVLTESNLKYGTTLTVECSAETEDYTDLKWVRESFKSRANYNNYEKSVSMTIISIIPMDFGKYTCIATRDGVQSSNSITIQRDPKYGNRFRYTIESDKKSGDLLPKSDYIKSEDTTKVAYEYPVAVTHRGPISTQTDVRIEQDFQTYTHEGETVSFTCLINDEVVKDIAWTRNHGYMPRNHKIIDNTLVLFNVTSSDTGYYICSYEDKSTYVYLGLVRRGYPITHVRIPLKTKQINVVEGDSVEIDCKVVGELETNTRWQKHQGELPSNHVLDGNKLKLNNIQISNYGYYECLGENILGNFSDFIYLDVKNKTEQLSREKAIHGDDINKKEEEDEEKIPTVEESSQSPSEPAETTTVLTPDETSTVFEPVVDETEADQGENVDETNVDDESDPTLDQNENGENEEQNEANDGDVSNEAEVNETEVETTPVVPTNEEVSTTETVPTEATPAEEEEAPLSKVEQEEPVSTQVPDAETASIETTVVAEETAASDPAVQENTVPVSIETTTVPEEPVAAPEESAASEEPVVSEQPVTEAVAEAQPVEETSAPEEAPEPTEAVEEAPEPTEAVEEPVTEETPAE